MLIVCAGMYRSASTWVFNAAKIIAKKKYPMEVTHGFGPAENPPDKVHVLKIHGWDKWTADKADIILTSHRDLRDVISSFRRMGDDPGLPKNLSDLKQVCASIYHSYRAWREADKCRFDLCYYRFADSGLTIYTRLLCDALDYAPWDLIALRDEIDATRQLKGTAEAHHPETFYHLNHFTNGKAGAWHRELSEEDLALIRAANVPLNCFEEGDHH